MALDSTAFHFVISAWLAKNEKDKGLQVFRELRAPQNAHLMYVFFFMLVIFRGHFFLSFSSPK